MPNTNPVTGIAFGSILLHLIDPGVAKTLIYQAADTEFEKIVEETRETLEGVVSSGKVSDADFEEELDRRVSNLPIDKFHYKGVWQGVNYNIDEFHGTAMLTITHSHLTDIYTPCCAAIAGAGDLSLPCTFGIKCYDIPANWRTHHA